MVMSTQISSVALGQRLTQLREAAGLKQAELARQVTWSPAVLSRVEAGDRELNLEELGELLDRIGTPDAASLREIVLRDWTQLPTPPLGHADQDLLWAANQVAAELAVQAQGEDVRPAFLKRLEEYREDIKHTAAQLLRREHNVAFIGAIGIGKSTAICKATGLEVVSAEGKATPVLETGGGGITLCEVSLKVGPGYGVIVTPRSNDEVRADVADFAEVLLMRSDVTSTADESDDSQRAVPRELERAIRNLSGLRATRTKGADGKAVRVDPAKALAVELGSAREVTVEILSLMGLPRRDRREAWYDATSNKSELEWLRETFEQINNGRHPDFTLPSHVDLIVPSLMEAADLTVTVIDTRGIDRATARADLEEHLLDSHTVSVLCSGFNDAPSQPVQHLLERARDIGNPLIDTHASVLALARPLEALAMKDDGISAESDEEGYELKGDEVLGALTPFGMQKLPIEFFNSFSDDPQRLRDFVLGRVEATRANFRAELEEVLEGAKALLDNVEMEQVLADQREAGLQVVNWLTNHVQPPSVNAHVHDSLMAAIRTAHVSTLNAAVRREGEWYSLSYSHQLGFGARRIAVSALKEWRVEFRGICNNLAETHADAGELLGQAERLMEIAYEELLRKMQVAGAALYREELQRAQVLWVELSGEWGRGSGYRDRVAQKQHGWFGEDAQKKVEQEILGVLHREWAGLRERVTAIFDVE